jgi:glycerophosphoryl diester phosphodiesterase
MGTSGRLRLLLGLVLFVVAVLVAVVVGRRVASAGDSAPDVYAHRGGTSALVENTRENYRRAAAAGSRYWETDVRFTRDNTAVLLHDSDLRRFGCPTVKIAAVPLARARECAAADGQVPTRLDDFVADQSAYSARSMIELKTVPTPAQWAALRPAFDRVKDHLVVESFLPDALVAASENGYATAFLTSKAVPAADLPAGTDWYAPQFSTLTEDQVRTMHRAGVRVVAWTPDCPDWAALPGDLDALISNDLESDCR